MVRSTSLKSGTDLVSFNYATVNDNNVFNMSTSTMTAPNNGLYWIHLSVGLEPGTATDVRLTGADK